MEPLDYYQIQIVLALMFREEARFSELNVTNLSSSHFNYHIEQLVQIGYVQKNVHARYELTSKGKKLATHIDIFSGELEVMPLTCVSALVVREQNGKSEYLVHQRNKHPHLGYYSLPGGKAKHGHLLINEVLRELKEETGLTGVPELIQINRGLSVTTGQAEVLVDAVYYIYKVTEPRGTLKDTKEGKNFWLSREEIITLKPVFSDLLAAIAHVESSASSLTFTEVFEEYPSI